jgi:ATP phosphoribosyltransferase
MELAPLVGLADAIVDIVSTGSTLKANDLIEVEEIMPISARLVVNQASLKTRHAQLAPLLASLQRAVQSASMAGAAS